VGSVVDGGGCALTIELSCPESRGEGGVLAGGCFSLPEQKRRGEV